MKNKYILLVLLLTSIVGCSNIKSTSFYVEVRDARIYNGTVEDNILDLSSEEENLTVKDVAGYLKTCKSHYPLSDEFIERYQQVSGGYLDYSKELGIVVDKQLHMPDQKTHFFVDWLDQCIMAKPSVLEADGKQRCYTNLLCPELLLWIFEACNVEHNLLLKCMEVAENGKSSGLTTSVIAKNMKQVVSWDDVKKGIVVPEYKDSDYTHSVSISGANVMGLKDSYVRGEKVSFKLDVNDNLELDKFNAPGLNDYICQEDDYYYFYMPDRDVSFSLSLKEKPAQTLIAVDKINVILNNTYQLNPKLSYGDGNFIYSSEDDNIAVVDENGLVKGLKVGSTNITVSCVEIPSLSKVISVNVKDSSNLVDSSYSVSYDLGTRKTSKLFENASYIYNSLLTDDENIINSISSFEYVYGGGNGGRNETSWVNSNMIKIGTTSVNGSITFNLNKEVNGIKITGYVNSQSLKLRVGDALSSDWEGNSMDNKTTTTDKTYLTIASKDSVENNNQTSITLTFDPTTNLKLATVNTTSSKHCLFITGIEFIYDEDLNK